MLIAKFENLNDVKWSLGNKADNVAYNQVCKCMFVYGEELDYVKQNFTGIPMVTEQRQMVVITEPFCDFVFKNLPR